MIDAQPDVLSPRFVPMDGEIVVKYRSAFGDFVVPPDVLTRATRQKRFGRPDYLEEWCRHQYERSRGH